MYKSHFKCSVSTCGAGRVRPRGHFRWTGRLAGLGLIPSSAASLLWIWCFTQVLWASVSSPVRWRLSREPLVGLRWFLHEVALANSIRPQR